VRNTVSKVAIVHVEKDAPSALKQAFKLVGEIDDLNTKERSVVIKVGLFDPRAQHHTTINVADAITKSFNKAPKIYISESDNYKGTGSERLQRWEPLFSERIVPFNLSEDTDVRQVEIAGEKIGLSHILFKPNVFVSTHILRQSEYGCILKNLLGLVPDRKKVRFHKKLNKALCDMYDAVGGIDLAVADGTRIAVGLTPKAKMLNAGILLVGRDAVAVDAVGAVLVGLNPMKMPIIKEAFDRGLGEANMQNIEVLGNSFEFLKERFIRKIKDMKS
jgi:uncharacterized protein (DUF362 family)